MKPELSIVIPAFEEQARLGDSLEKIFAFLKAGSANAEIVVVDDGSKDSTAEAARSVFRAHPEIRSNVIRYEPNRGKGYATKIGLQAANADVALFSEADLSTPI